MAADPYVSLSVRVMPDTELTTVVQDSATGGDFLGWLDVGRRHSVAVTVGDLASLDRLIDSLRQLREQAITHMEQAAVADQPSLIDDLEAVAAS